MKNQNGQMFILATIVLVLVMINVVLVISNSLTLFQNSKYSSGSLTATNLAEAGIDKAVASLNKSGGTYNGESEVKIGAGSFGIVITPKDPSTKIVESTGYIPNKANPKYKKTIRTEISKGDGVAFHYGVQIGEGGLRVDQQSTINGGIYSNGNVFLEQQTIINGDVYVAGGTQPTPDQEFDCSSPGCTEIDYQFGKNISGENRLDVAQSFKPSQTAVINKVAIKLKKIGSGPHPNLTVKILGNNASNNPDKNNLKALGTLSSVQVTSQYSYIEVALTSTPILSADTYYWIVVDTSSNSTNYWSWSKDTLGGYNCASNPPCYAKFSPDHNAGNPVWTNISGDLGFKVYMGGVATRIDGSGNGGNISKINGVAKANTLNNLSILDNAFYQAQSNITANGQNCSTDPSPPKCNPNSEDPPPIPMPISQAQIDKWKDEADNNVITGDITNCPSTLAFGKYVGNITLPPLCTITIESPIWVTGNFYMDQNSKLRLNSSYGLSSGVFIVDGTSTLIQQNKLQGSCQEDKCTNGSYLMLISEYPSKTDPLETAAIYIEQQGNSGVLYANNGKIEVNQQNTFAEITAWKIYLHQQVIVNYDAGLAGSFFSSGPSGSYSILKGSYQSK